MDWILAIAIVLLAASHVLVAHQTEKLRKINNERLELLLERLERLSDKEAQGE